MTEASVCEVGIHILDVLKDQVGRTNFLSASTRPRTRLARHPVVNHSVKLHLFMVLCHKAEIFEKTCWMP